VISHQHAGVDFAALQGDNAVDHSGGVRAAIDQVAEKDQRLLGGRAA